MAKNAVDQAAHTKSTQEVISTLLFLFSCCLSCFFSLSCCCYFFLNYIFYKNIPEAGSYFSVIFARNHQRVSSNEVKSRCKMEQPPTDTPERTKKTLHHIQDSQNYYWIVLTKQNKKKTKKKNGPSTFVLLNFSHFFFPYSILKAWLLLRINPCQRQVGSSCNWGLKRVSRDVAHDFLLSLPYNFPLS